MSAARSKAPLTARINDTSIGLLPGETLLDAAHRQGIGIPYSCRVGGCATCKCRLLEGRVRELTETSYLFSDEELDGGFILACQSIPETDVAIEFRVPATTAPRRVSGRITGQHRLTRDIMRLQVRLDQGFNYRAGQHAGLSVGALPGIRRPYSFATPPRLDPLVEFFVRRVDGGALSPLVNDTDLIDQPVQLDGPLGDFILAPGTGPLLFVAGGSGLAPILAILGEALAQGGARPVTLLFGARTRADLYCLDEIREMARRWRAPFIFEPVLSQAGDDGEWNGRTGWVADHIPETLAPGTSALLCGPPGMIDAAVERLTRAGFPRESIHADRFTTGPESARAQNPAATAGRSGVATPARASAFDYLKYGLFHLIGLAATASFIAGGWWITACLLALLAFYLGGDAICGEDRSTPEYGHPAILTAFLWLALPLLAFIVFASLWSVSPGDPLGFGAWITAATGHDVLAARAATHAGHHVAGFLLTGLMIGMIGTIPAHELTHRTWDPVSLRIGRWLLAFSFDTIFSIEHVYGHHRYVSTTEDPATAPRGRNVYAHIVASTLKGNASAWKIEARSRRRRGLPVYSPGNAVIRGHLMSLGLTGLAWSMGGPATAAYFVACALWGKVLLEIVNYMEHYGMVRDPATPVQPRHSWNTTRRISSWSLFNLTRHSHHHAQGEVPFHELQPFPDAPTMIGGYLTTIVVALIPPLWFRLMDPKVREWDRDHASAAERELAALADARASRARAA